MAAVMLVEVLDVHGHVQHRLRLAGAGSQIRIGRSIVCDLPIDDAFAAAEHVLLQLQQDGRVLVRDLETLNGTRLGRQLIDARDGRIIAGGELLIGRTVVRVRTAETPLPPERRFRRDLLRRYRSLLALAGLLLCLAFAAFLQWTYDPEQLAQRILVAELLVVAGLTLWVGAWALVSRLTVGAWQVRVHLAIATCCVAMWLWGYWLYALGAFALQWSWLGTVMAGLAGLVALLAAYLHVRNATTFQRVVAVLLAALAPLLGGGVWWLVDLQVDPRSVNHVEGGADIFPPSLRLAPSVDAGDYLGDMAALKRSANRNRQQSLLESPIFDVGE
jgi:hypothetical protein